MKKIVRSSQDNEIVVKKGKNILTLNEEEFFNDHQIYGAIRIRKKEFKFIKLENQYLTHFNLQWTTHKKGKIYSLPLIIKPGYFTAKKEVLPVLLFDNCLVARCITARNSLKYEDLKKEDFKYSSVKNKEELKKNIVERYKKSMPHLSVKEIISLGVGMTKLNLLKRWEE